MCTALVLFSWKVNYDWLAKFKREINYCWLLYFFCFFNWKKKKLLKSISRAYKCLVVFYLMHLCKKIYVRYASFGLVALCVIAKWRLLGTGVKMFEVMSFEEWFFKIFANGWNAFVKISWHISPMHTKTFLVIIAVHHPFHIVSTSKSKPPNSETL